MIETVAEFVRLVESGDSAERKRSAWEDAPTSVWLELVNDHSTMRFWVANNRTVPNEVLRILAHDTDWRVRNRVASKASCPEDILELLSSDDHDSVVSSVAGHPHTSSDALRRLATHEWEQVRAKAIRQLAERDEPALPVDRGL
jgi:HEAT repeat protein